MPEEWAWMPRHCSQKWYRRVVVLLVWLRRFELLLIIIEIITFGQGGKNVSLELKSAKRRKQKGGRIMCTHAFSMPAIYCHLSLSLRVFFRSVCECKQKDSILMTQNNTFVWMFEFISKNVEWLCETDSNWHEMCFTVSRQIMLNEWNVELCVGLVWFEWSFAHACEFVFSEMHRIYDNKNALMRIFYCCCCCCLICE